jgi:hypothetical protein
VSKKDVYLYAHLDIRHFEFRMQFRSNVNLAVWLDELNAVEFKL